MKFIRPIDGDVLFSVADGVATAGGLRTKITLFRSCRKEYPD